MIEMPRLEQGPAAGQTQLGLHPITTDTLIKTELHYQHLYHN